MMEALASYQIVDFLEEHKFSLVDQYDYSKPHKLFTIVLCMVSFRMLITMPQQMLVCWVFLNVWISSIMLVQFCHRY